MLRGDEVWCQLFSEPGAGSDLASLATRAVRDGDQWIVNGQKVWTSGARQSDWAILLARTDPDARSTGASRSSWSTWRTPGIDVRPLRQINGGYHFNEVFLTDVRGARTPTSSATVDDGWRVAMTTLTNERHAHRSAAAAGRRAGRPHRPRPAAGRARDPVLRQQLVELLHPRARLLRYLGYRTRSALGRRAARSGPSRRWPS